MARGTRSLRGWLWGSILLLVAGAGLVLLLATYVHQVVQPRGKPNVLLITVDTLRADHMSLYNYSRATTRSIERWFGKGRVFERAYSTEASTSPSVVSILTGLLPQRHRVRLLYQKMPPEVATMADYFKAAGYETAAVVSNLVLTDEAIALGSRFDYYDDFVDEREPYRRIFERRASRTTDAAIKWLRRFRSKDKPHFFWIHYIDPHGPYHPPQDRPIDFTHDTPRLIQIEQVPGYQREPGVRDGLEYVDLYDEEIAYVDREIGRLLKEYARLGLDGNAVVALTADHGETMMEFERWFTHAYHVYEPIIHVPLALFGAGITPGRIKTPVSLVDLMPTLMQAAGLSVSDDLDGRSLLGTVEGRPVFAEATYGIGRQWRCAINGAKKWLVAVQTHSGKVTDGAVYPVAQEPHRESYDQWNERDPVAGQLLALIRRDPDPAGRPLRYDQGVRLSAPKVAPDVDKETLDKLKALGYAR